MELPQEDGNYTPIVYLRAHVQLLIQSEVAMLESKERDTNCQNMKRIICSELE